MEEEIRGRSVNIRRENYGGIDWEKAEAPLNLPGYEEYTGVSNVPPVRVAGTLEYHYHNGILMGSSDWLPNHPEQQRFEHYKNLQACIQEDGLVPLPPLQLAFTPQRRVTPTISDERIEAMFRGEIMANTPQEFKALFLRAQRDIKPREQNRKLVDPKSVDTIEVEVTSRQAETLTSNNIVSGELEVISSNSVPILNNSPTVAEIASYENIETVSEMILDDFINRSRRIWSKKYATFKKLCVEGKMQMTDSVVERHSGCHYLAVVSFVRFIKRHRIVCTDQQQRRISDIVQRARVKGMEYCIIPIQDHHHTNIPVDGRKYAHKHECEVCGEFFEHTHMRHSYAKSISYDNHRCSVCMDISSTDHQNTIELFDKECVKCKLPFQHEYEGTTKCDLCTDVEKRMNTFDDTLSMHSCDTFATAEGDDFSDCEGNETPSEETEIFKDDSESKTICFTTLEPEEILIIMSEGNFQRVMEGMQHLVAVKKIIVLTFDAPFLKTIFEEKFIAQCVNDGLELTTMSAMLPDELMMYKIICQLVRISGVQVEASDMELDEFGVSIMDSESFVFAGLTPDEMIDAMKTCDFDSVVIGLRELVRNRTLTRHSELKDIFEDKFRMELDENEEFVISECLPPAELVLYNILCHYAKEEQMTGNSGEVRNVGREDKNSISGLVHVTINGQTTMGLAIDQYHIICVAHGIDYFMGHCTITAKDFIRDFACGGSCQFLTARNQAIDMVLIKTPWPIPHFKFVLNSSGYQLHHLVGNEHCNRDVIMRLVRGKTQYASNNKLVTLPDSYHYRGDIDKGDSGSVLTYNGWPIALHVCGLCQSGAATIIPQAVLEVIRGVIMVTPGKNQEILISQDVMEAHSM
jgi:hypothetical protein